jgi:hypothetical protein
MIPRRTLRVALLLMATTVYASGCGEARRSTDPDLVLQEEHPSPDGRFVLLVYKVDHGALGYSRLWWAVAPARYQGVNLVRYELPDGYRGVGWAATGELQVRAWTPYYFKETSRELNSGDVFAGVKVQVLPEHAAPGKRETDEPDRSGSSN